MLYFNNFLLVVFTVSCVYTLGNPISGAAAGVLMVRKKVLLWCPGQMTLVGWRVEFTRMEMPDMMGHGHQEGL